MVKKKITKVLIVAIITMVLLLVGGGIWWGKKKNSLSVPAQKPDKPNLPPPLPNNNEKKELVEKIKNYLREEIEKSKKGENAEHTIVASKAKGYIYLIGEPLHLFGDIKFYPHDIGNEDYRELINLGKQTKTEYREWVKKRKEEADQKLTHDPNLFFDPGPIKLNNGLGFPDYWKLESKQGGKKYFLTIPLNHPVFTNFPLRWGEDDYKYFRITGTENIPSEPTSWNKNVLIKIVKLENQITIEKIDF